MGRARDNHRPLVSGIRIKSRIGRHDLQRVGAGTLTGLATRRADGKKVLVTNLHVMAGDDEGSYRNPSGDEEMYQGLGNPRDKVGGNLVWEPLSFTGKNKVDVAMCELEDDVAAEFTLHDAPEHSDRKIIAGVMEPVKDDENPMELTMLGASTGEVTATVTDIDREGEFGGVEFDGLIQMRSSSPLLDGDSGSPCLYKVREGVYKMVGIMFGVDLWDSQVAWAFPASVAQQKLGITFGNRPPVASASAWPSKAAPGATGHLGRQRQHRPRGRRLDLPLGAGAWRRWRADRDHERVQGGRHLHGAYRSGGFDVQADCHRQTGADCDGRGDHHCAAQPPSGSRCRP